MSSRSSAYKGTRLSVAQRRQEHFRKVWYASDVPYFWGMKLADREELRAMLTGLPKAGRPRLEAKPECPPS